VGRIELVERSDVDAYFTSRPDGARIGAVVSRQSRAVISRQELDSRATELAELPARAPAWWGGLCLVADELEFWQGRGGRLHDRICFLRLDAVGGTPVSAAAVDAAGGIDHVLAAGTRVEDAHGTGWLRLRLEP